MTDREREALQLALDASAKAAAMHDLSTTVGEMTGELRAVSDALVEEQSWRRRFIAALCAFALLFALLAVVALQNRENGRVIRDTIDPGGERYERIQKAQAEAIAGLVDAIDDRNRAAIEEATDCLLGRGPCPGDS